MSPKLTAVGESTGSLGATPAQLRVAEGGLRDLDFKAKRCCPPSLLGLFTPLPGAARPGSQPHPDPPQCRAAPVPYRTFTISCAICLVLLTSRTILASLTTE